MEHSPQRCCNQIIINPIQNYTNQKKKNPKQIEKAREIATFF